MTEVVEEDVKLIVIDCGSPRPYQEDHVLHLYDSCGPSAHWLHPRTL